MQANFNSFIWSRGSKIRRIVLDAFSNACYNIFNILKIQKANNTKKYFDMIRIRSSTKCVLFYRASSEHSLPWSSGPLSASPIFPIKLCALHTERYFLGLAKIHHGLRRSCWYREVPIVVPHSRRGPITCQYRHYWRTERNINVYDPMCVRSTPGGQVAPFRSVAFLPAALRCVPFVRVIYTPSAYLFHE